MLTPSLYATRVPFSGEEINVPTSDEEPVPARYILKNDKRGKLAFTHRGGSASSGSNNRAGSDNISSAKVGEDRYPEKENNLFKHLTTQEIQQIHLW